MPFFRDKIEYTDLKKMYMEEIFEIIEFLLIKDLIEHVNIERQKSLART